MDTKDKAIIWVLYLIVAMVIPLNIYGCVIGAIIVGVAIKLIDANFTNIICWLQDHFNADSRQ